MTIDTNPRPGESYWDWRLRTEQAGGPSAAPRPAEPNDSQRHLLAGDDTPTEVCACRKSNLARPGTIPFAD